MISSAIRVLRATAQAARSALRTRAELNIENLALRQQLLTLKLQSPRPRLGPADRAFWVLLRKYWAGWRARLVIVEPDTVARWHRHGFRLFWRWKSLPRNKPGRPKIDLEIRTLIRRLALENLWRAPKVHAELLKLGFDVSERTVSRYLPRIPATPDQIERWMTFLRNHRDVLAGMDFFVVPTATFRLLYALVFVHHGRRKVLHFNVTEHPTEDWVIQQIREAFPYDPRVKYLILDRDSIFSPRVRQAIKDMGITPKRISKQSPWQNGVTERWIGSCRRELLDHVVVFNRDHLMRLARDYIDYYHQDRCHLGLGKDPPKHRPVTPRPSPTATVIGLPRVGGLHHRYEWQEAG